MKLFCTLIFLFAAFPAATGQNYADFRKKNAAHHYNPDAEVRLAYHVAKSGDKAAIFFKITTLDGIALQNNYAINYELRKDYATAQPLQEDSVAYAEMVFSDGNNFYFKKELLLPEGDALVLINVANRHTDNVYSFDIPLSNEFIFPQSNLLITRDGQPRFQNFVHVNDTIAIAPVTDADSAAVDVYLYQYAASFQPADPPMSTAGAPVRENLSIDSLIVLRDGQPFFLEKPGLYFAQEDTSSLSGVGFLVEDMFFPRMAEIEDVIAPLIYITTRAEREKLGQAEDKKKELDRFWLNLAKSPDRAKKLIRSYYQRVREANLYFTSYKQGWKTDQGMIYILFGPPHEVYRDAEKEEWIYEKIDDIPGMSFTFVKVKNIFTDNHFGLMRDPAYEKYWYRVVDLWRKGRFSGSAAN